MPAFKSERPLTRSEYARRRDQTTREELQKLKSTPEYKKFAKSKGIPLETSSNSKQFSISAIIIALVSVMLIASFAGNVSSTEILGHAVASEEKPVEQQIEAQQTCNLDLEYAVVELTSHLKSTEIELHAAQRENMDLIKALQFERSQVQSCPAPIIPRTPIIPAATFGNLQWAILGATGCIVSLVILVTKRRIRAETNTLRSENIELVSQLQELAFEKDMAEQSISILESELQRKMSQLAEAQSQQKKQPATPVAGPDDTASPRIRAVQQQKAGAMSPTPLSLTTTPTVPTSPLLMSNTNGMYHHPQRTPPDSLPPPPRQLVERFLEERGAIAIEQEQVQAWLQMESLYGQLQREVTRLRAIVEGREGESEEQKKRIEELNRALEEQKEAARKAKEALRAVRAVGVRENYSPVAQ